MTNFEEYKKLGEPDKKEKVEIWETAIGLQEVDGLTPSDFLFDTASQHIEGKLTVSDAKRRIYTYYTENPTTNEFDMQVEEADKVSAHIAEVLSEKAFVFSPAEYIEIHRRLFEDVFDHAGKVRKNNIAKREWVLDGESVVYSSAQSIMTTLEYDFKQEKMFEYKGLTKRQKVEHIAGFVSNIWQIHPFNEGNTRTTAVFAIKYLRSLGFDIENDMFAEHSYFFRNALVRANYTKYELEVYSTFQFLFEFFGNLMLGEKNVLDNNRLHIFFDKKLNRVVKAKQEKVEFEGVVANSEVDVLRNKVDTVKPQNDVEDGKKGSLNDVLSLIEKYEKITAIEMAKILKVSLITIKRRIKVLTDSQMIVRVGSLKTGFWKVVK